MFLLTIEYLTFQTPCWQCQNHLWVAQAAGGKVSKKTTWGVLQDHGFGPAILLGRAGFGPSYASL